MYFPKLGELIQLVINPCDLCQQVKYDRHPIKNKFQFTETPSNKNQIIHIDTYVIKGHHFLTTIDKFSKFGAAYSLSDRNHVTIIEKLEEHITKIGKPNKIIADNEFKALRIKEFLIEQGIELHLTKPNSHTGNSDIERFHNTIAEKFRILYQTNRDLPIQQLIQRTIRNYNERFHSSIKYSPKEVQEGRINLDRIKQNLEECKKKKIDKLNLKREEYRETREEGFIKKLQSTKT